MGESNTEQNRLNFEPGGAGAETGPANTSPAADSGAGAGAGAGTPAPAPVKRSHKRKTAVVQADLVGMQPEVVSINIPDQPPGEAAAPKRSHKKKPPAPVDLSQLENNIEMLGAAAFGMIGLATNQPALWTVAPEEMQRISKPAARIVDRAGQLETTNKYADYVMILGAAALIIIPRLMAMKMEKQLSGPKIPQEVKTNGAAANRGNRDTNQPSTGPVQFDSQNPFNALYEVN